MRQRLRPHLTYSNYTDASPVTILTLDEMTLSARCFVAPIVGDNELQLYLTSTVDARINFAYLDRLGFQSLTPREGEKSLSSGVQTQWTGEGTFGDFERFEGQLIYRNSSRVISVTFHASEDPDAGSCQMTGTAVSASS